MITEPTVFILGAGASYAYGYPTGQGLREFICKEFEHSLLGYRFRKHPEANEEILDEKNRQAKVLRDRFYLSTNPSIDIWLSRNKSFIPIGKIAIACGIHDTEKERPEAFRENITSEIDWYTFLFRRMIRELIGPDDYKNFKNNKVSFITFNYDRSLEHFMHQSFSNTFTEIPAPERNMKELIPFEFLHVYGQIAKLPFQIEPDEWSLEYGYDNSKDPFIEKMADNIEIIYDRNENH
jgi:hypothetical protein